MTPAKALIATAVSLVVTAASATADSVCYGSTAKGRLRDACRLPESGSNYVPYSPEGIRQGRTYVHCRVAEVVAAAYAELTRRVPSALFVYGETGKADGGDFAPHKTHQNGLSVDFFVPVRDRGDQPARVPSTPGNRWGYDLEFDARGQAGNVSIDFEAMAQHLLALAEAAQARGVGIRRVYFDTALQQRLHETSVWTQISARIPFSTTEGWWRHDEHYHVDFEVACRPGP